MFDYALVEQHNEAILLHCAEVFAAEDFGGTFLDILSPDLLTAIGIKLFSQHKAAPKYHRTILQLDHVHGPWGGGLWPIYVPIDLRSVGSNDGCETRPKARASGGPS